MVPNVDLLFGLLLAVVVLTNFARQLRIAYPILLVLGGLVLSFIPGVPSIALSPNLVLVLFLPPLLYWESLNVSYRDLRFSIRPVLSLAIGLVLATIVVIAVAALAMGLQTTTVRSLRVAGLSTTVLTSNIASVIEGVVARLNSLSSSSAPPPRPVAGETEAAGSISSHVGLQMAVIVAYGVSAGCVALFKSRLLPSGLWLPAGLVLLVVLSGRWPHGGDGLITVGGQQPKI